MDNVFPNGEWKTALANLDATRVPVLFPAGEHNLVPVTGRTAHLAEQYRTVTSVSHGTANNDLPFGESAWCRLLLNAAPSQERPTAGR